MKTAIVYSSKTGNTKVLAQSICTYLDEKNIVYFGEPSADALQADTIYVGFWTDKGECTSSLVTFLEGLHHKHIFLFGTAGFGGEQAYFDQILARVLSNVASDNTILGTFMCQGKMPMAIRERYVSLANENKKMQPMIDNFDKALSHPDAADLQHLLESIASSLQKGYYSQLNKRP